MTFAEYNARLCNKDLQEYFQYLLWEREKGEGSWDENPKDTIAELQGLVIPGNLDGKTVIELREQNKIARNLAQQGKIEESIAIVQQILEVYKEHYDAYYTLGLISFEQGNIIEALDCFRYAFEYNPFFTDAVLRIFDCYVCLKNANEISDILSKALTLQPKDPELLEIRLHLENGTYPKHLEEKIKPEKKELKDELLSLKEMLESGNAEEALQKIKSLV